MALVTPNIYSLFSLLLFSSISSSYASINPERKTYIVHMNPHHLHHPFFLVLLHSPIPFPSSLLLFNLSSQEATLSPSVVGVCEDHPLPSIPPPRLSLHSLPLLQTPPLRRHHPASAPNPLPSPPPPPPSLLSPPAGKANASSTPPPATASSSAPEASPKATKWPPAFSKQSDDVASPITRLAPPVVATYPKPASSFTRVAPHVEWLPAHVSPPTRCAGKRAAPGLTRPYKAALIYSLSPLAAERCRTKRGAAPPRTRSAFGSVLWTSKTNHVRSPVSFMWTRTVG